MPEKAAFCSFVARRIFALQQFSTYTGLMDMLFSLITPSSLAVAVLVAALSGVIKGVVGFGMPLILISGLSTFIGPELALAGLMLPTVVTNGMQALRHGWPAVKGSVRQFRVFLLVGAVALVISAQFVRFLPEQAFLLIIGLPVLLFSLMQLLGIHFSLSAPSVRIEAAVAAFAGFVGGFSGTWGPPTVAYLTALGTEKGEQLRVQGVIYGLGAVALLLAHIGSGIVRVETMVFSATLLPPAVLGMWIGGLVHDRIDQVTFRKATLIVLTLAALNLIRRAIMG